MKMPLNNFKTEYRELVLNFLWRQWSALGVAGSVTSDDNWILDAEALLIFTCTMGRHDARVFDEMVDWLHKNGAFINIASNLRRIMLEVRPLIERAGFAHQLSDDQQHHGEVYLEVFFSDIRRLLK
jgi:hypothetical protein